MGSASDAGVMKGCVDVLKEMKIPHEVKILSAHRT
ncbi:MAG: AIR carboxylase family protein, partial [Deltaproteobacteria bacterium]|nr:AIR carboxylase family protein [Deltaproteobacteria bacterium]